MATCKVVVFWSSLGGLNSSAAASTAAGRLSSSWAHTWWDFRRLSVNFVLAHLTVHLAEPPFALHCIASKCWQLMRHQKAVSELCLFEQAADAIMWMQYIFLRLTGSCWNTVIRSFWGPEFEATCFLMHCYQLLGAEKECCLNLWFGIFSRESWLNTGQLDRRESMAFLAEQSDLLCQSNCPYQLNSLNCSRVTVDILYCTCIAPTHISHLGTILEKPPFDIW